MQFVGIAPLFLVFILFSVGRVFRDIWALRKIDVALPEKLRKEIKTGEIVTPVSWILTEKYLINGWESIKILPIENVTIDDRSTTFTPIL